MFPFRVCFYSVVYLITRKVNPDYLNMTLINRKLMETNGLTMPTFFLFVTILAAMMCYVYHLLNYRDNEYRFASTICCG